MHLHCFSRAPGRRVARCFPGDGVLRIVVASVVAFLTDGLPYSPVHDHAKRIKWKLSLLTACFNLAAIGLLTPAHPITRSKRISTAVTITSLPTQSPHTNLTSNVLCQRSECPPCQQSSCVSSSRRSLSRMCTTTTRTITEMILTHLNLYALPTESSPSWHPCICLWKHVATSPLPRANWILHLCDKAIQASQPS